MELVNLNIDGRLSEPACPNSGGDFPIGRQPFFYFVYDEVRLGWWRYFAALAGCDRVDSFNGGGRNPDQGRQPAGGDHFWCRGY